jgi:hypothetical protein
MSRRLQSDALASKLLRLTMTLSRFARVALRHFLAAWVSGRHRLRTPKEVAEAIDKLEDARRRNDCRAIGYWRKRVAMTRMDALSMEVRGQHWRTS